MTSIRDALADCVRVYDVFQLMKHLIQKIHEFDPELPGQSDHCATSVARVPNFFKYPMSSSC
ncbi:MAG: hypothetical protein VXW49_17590, partial [Pseudomonadota bacterium]|nr:hypothetical protein [Pseudomonadota bacterium]